MTGNRRLPKSDNDAFQTVASIFTRVLSVQVVGLLKERSCRIFNVLPQTFGELGGHRFGPGRFQRNDQVFFSGSGQQLRAILRSDFLTDVGTDSDDSFQPGVDGQRLTWFDGRMETIGSFQPEYVRVELKKPVQRQAKLTACHVAPFLEDAPQSRSREVAKGVRVRMEGVEGTRCA